jgi:hypothetical protein
MLRVLGHTVGSCQSYAEWLQSSNNGIVSTQVTTFHINQTFAPYNTSEFFREEVLISWNELMPRKDC